MAKQAEVEFSKASKEIEQQEQKIIKANDYIEKELKQQQNLKNEKLEVEKDVQELAKKSDNFEYVLNGCKENLRLAREGKFLLLRDSTFLPTCFMTMLPLKECRRVAF